jgi:hypothetical protein
LFGFADLLAIRGDQTMAIQVTTNDHVAERIEKIRQRPEAAIWMRSPTRTLAVHGWALKGGRGESKTFQCREVILSADADNAANTQTQTNDPNER